MCFYHLSLVASFFFLPKAESPYIAVGSWNRIWCWSTSLSKFNNTLLIFNLYLVSNGVVKLQQYRTVFVSLNPWKCPVLACLDAFFCILGQILKGWFGSFEVGLYEVLIHSQYITYSRWWSAPPQFGEAGQSTDTEANQCITMEEGSSKTCCSLLKKIYIGLINYI